MEPSLLNALEGFDLHSRFRVKPGTAYGKPDDQVG